MIRTFTALVAASLLFSGCANKRGVSAAYYNDCRAYYDLYGGYHETCDPNLVDYDEAAAAVRGLFSDKEPEPRNRKVW